MAVPASFLVPGSLWTCGDSVYNISWTQIIIDTLNYLHFDGPPGHSYPISKSYSPSTLLDLKCYSQEPRSSSPTTTSATAKDVSGPQHLPHHAPPDLEQEWLIDDAISKLNLLYVQRCASPCSLYFVEFLGPNFPGWSANTVATYRKS